MSYHDWIRIEDNKYDQTFDYTFNNTSMLYREHPKEKPINTDMAEVNLVVRDIILDILPTIDEDCNGRLNYVREDYFLYSDTFPCPKIFLQFEDVHVIFDLVTTNRYYLGLLICNNNDVLIYTFKQKGREDIEYQDCIVINNMDNIEKLLERSILKWIINDL